ncbi:hypothetical protein MKZ38_002633 [Zalerion maritima]|uniref:SGNH hydrolase-type esterase domain-containing protein n=1 Tax=Zalerion maritima TaxID=339359 RepID=A0AAD5RY80_9PEZI|nr:hypothetical protein MKZ38_002633 [Zalerion maritima]
MKVSIFIILFLSLSLGELWAAAAPITIADHALTVHQRRGVISKIWDFLSLGPKHSAPSSDGTLAAPGVVDIPSTASILSRPVPVAFILAPNSTRPGRFVAFGDSYSAGFGADLGYSSDDRCRRGKRSHPNLLAEDMAEFDGIWEDLGLHSSSSAPTAATSENGTSAAAAVGEENPGGVSLKGERISPRSTTAPEHLLWLSCSGAVTEDLLSFPEDLAYKVRKATGKWSWKSAILDLFRGKNDREGFSYPDPKWPGPFLSGEDKFSRQLDSWNPAGGEESDMAILSLGGNDLGFSKILLSCVLHKGACKENIDVAVQKAKSPEFRMRYWSIFDEMFRKANSDSFVLTATGYARFFNAETDYCDQARFGAGKGAPAMDKGTRGLLNSLVVLINGELQSVVEGYNVARFGTAEHGDRLGSSKDERGARVLFVNADSKYEGHRFCEQGVQEPDRGNPNNWFFNYLGWDHEVSRGDKAYAARIEVDELKKVKFPRCVWEAVVSFGFDNKEKNVEPDGGRDAMTTAARFGMCFLRLLVDLDPSKAPEHWHWDEVPELGTAAVGEEQADRIILEAEEKARGWKGGGDGKVEGNVVGVPLEGEKAEEGELGKRGFLQPLGTLAPMPTVLGKAFHPKWAGHRAIRDILYERWLEIGWAVPATELLGIDKGENDHEE